MRGNGRLPPFPLALIGVALLAAVFVARNAVQSTGADSAEAPSAPQPAAPAAQLTPERALEAALSTNPGSARFHVEASLRANGRTGTLEVTGATDDSAKDPRVQLDAKVDALGTEVEGGFVTTGGEAWFTRNRTGYPVPLQATPTNGISLNPARWVKDVKDEGTESIDGVETRHLSASVDAAAVLSDLGRALPAGAARQLDDVVKRADFDVWAGVEDRILRRMTADAEFAVPGSEPVQVALEIELSEVGRPQRIDPPAKVSQDLPAGEFGALVRTVLGDSAPAGNQPQRLQRALRDNRKVVLLFLNTRGLDDRIVEDSLGAVRRETRALTLTDSVDNADRYGSLVESLGVSQTPSIVVIDRDGKARLVEGYVDAESLVQVVADAR